MKLTEEQLQNNYDKLIELIQKMVTDRERKDRLLKLYTLYSKVIKSAPASDVNFHHNAMKGGYVEHVLRVIKFSINVHKLYITLGFEIDYTDEELFMVALNHDLGKIGDEDGQLYLYNESDWHRTNQGKIYKKNDVLDFMEVQDRSLYLLQSNGVYLTKNEYLGIKLHDGLYAQSSEYYYKTFNQGNKLKTLLPYVVHQGDIMASTFEYRRWLKDSIEDTSKNKMEHVMTNETVEKINDIFANTFSESK